MKLLAHALILLSLFVANTVNSSDRSEGRAFDVKAGEVDIIPLFSDCDECKFWVKVEIKSLDDSDPTYAPFFAFSAVSNDSMKEYRIGVVKTEGNQGSVAFAGYYDAGNVGEGLLKENIELGESYSFLVSWHKTGYIDMLVFGERRKIQLEHALTKAELLVSGMELIVEPYKPNK